MGIGVIFIDAESLPEAWEKSLIQLAERGVVIDTEYGERSVDAPAVILVKTPFSEPRVHLKGIVAGSLKGLIDYVDEVVRGVHDHLVEKLEYTYHERLFSYRLPGGEIVNQITRVIEKLKRAPYTRRAQAITWQPWRDLISDHPPCLQRLWFRVVDGRLVLHAHMRSNDALKAAFMNMYAFTELQKYVAEHVGVEIGYYMHIADSYHVYERDWKWFYKFVEQIKTGESKKKWITTSDYYRRISAINIK